MFCNQGSRFARFRYSRFARSRCSKFWPLFVVFFSVHFFKDCVEFRVEDWNVKMRV